MNWGVWDQDETSTMFALSFPLRDSKPLVPYKTKPTENNQQWVPSVANNILTWASLTPLMKGVFSEYSQEILQTGISWPM